MFCLSKQKRRKGNNMKSQNAISAIGDTFLAPTKAFNGLKEALNGFGLLGDDFSIKKVEF